MKKFIAFCFASLLMFAFTPIYLLAKAPPQIAHYDILLAPCEVGYTGIEATVTETLELQYSNVSVITADFADPQFAWLVEDPGQAVLNYSTVPLISAKSSSTILAVRHPRICFIRDTQPYWKTLNYNIRTTRRT
jgi:hypothetical protein